MMRKKAIGVVLILYFALIAEDVRAQHIPNITDSIKVYEPDSSNSWINYLFDEEDLNDTSITGIFPAGSFEEKFEEWNSLIDNYKVVVEKVKLDVEYRFGIKVKAIGYFDNGKKCVEAEFNKSGLDGTVIWYYKSGQKRSTRFYKNGRFNHPEIIWHENGEVRAISDSGPNGQIFTSWHEDGSIKEKWRNYKDGLEHKNYHKNGLLRGVYYSNNGISDYLYYYKSGQPNIQGKILNNEIFRVGEWKYFYRNGKKEMFKQYHDSIPNYPVGTWKYWNEKGELVKEEVYEAGKLKDAKEFFPLSKD